MTTTVDTQLEHLDDADIYATAWKDVLSKFYASSDESATHLRWGGRGQGGRGLARRTVQTKAVSIPNVRLEYANSKTLLDDTLLKLHSGHVYGLVGATGRGKSSLLRRLDAHKIPGFPPHLSTLYLHPHTIARDYQTTEETAMTPVEWILETTRENSLRQKVHRNVDEQMEALQVQLDDALERDDNEAIDDISNQMALLDDDGDDSECTEAMILNALERMGLNNAIATQPISSLTAGGCQKVCLTMTLLYRADIILLDNPTYGLDVQGLLRLRDVIGELNSNHDVMILLASNDCDLVNDLCTNMIEFTSHAKLQHYQGSYWDYAKLRETNMRSQERQEATREKKATAMTQTLDNLKRQSVPKRGGAKKKSRQVNSHKRRMERILGSPDTGREEEEQERASSFRFERCVCQWNEPLVFATDVAHGGKEKEDGRYLFDCVDMCIEEGERYCILGENGSGKSTLLRLLAGLLDPAEGKVVHALGLEIGYISQQNALEEQVTREATTPLQYLTELYPLKTEQDIRGEMTRFGLRPKIQSEAPLEYLSDGERFRLRLAQVMLRRPQILFLDDPTAFLDLDSVNSLADASSQWNGTVVMASHDTHFLRSMEPIHYFVLVADQGKLCRLDGNVDEYLRSF